MRITRGGLVKKTDADGAYGALLGPNVWSGTQDFSGATVTGIAGGGGGGTTLTPTAVKTSAYTAAAGDFVPVDATAGTVTVTLPVSPADKTQIAVKMVARGGTFQTTVACGAGARFNVATTGSSTRVLNVLGESVLMQYKASNSVWYIISNDLSLVQNDAAITGAWRFDTFPSAFGPSGDSVPIYGRTSTDGLSIGKWNIIDDSPAGDLFHFTTGPNKGDNGAVIAIGNHYGGHGIVINNYGGDGSGKNTGGLNVTNLALIDNAVSYGVQFTQQSNLSPLFRIRSSAADSAPLLIFSTDQAQNAGTYLTKWAANGVNFGAITADTGIIDWAKTIQTTALASGDVPTIKVMDEASPKTTVYLAAKTIGETGLRVYRSLTDGSTAYAYGWLATTDRLKLQVGNGAAAIGSETLNTMIEVRCSTAKQMGFFGVTPVARPGVMTQTYATTSRTVGTPSASLTDSSGGTSGGNTIAAVSDIATAANAIATLAAKVNAILGTDIVNIKGVQNSVIDDLQALGFEQ